MAWLNIYQNMKQAIQDVIAPEMQQIRGDIRALSARMDSLEKSIDARFDSVDPRFDEFGKLTDQLAYEFRMSLDVRERLAALEARFEKKN